MTTVTFLTEGKRIIGFDAKGHSGYASAGEDIVLGLAASVKVHEKSGSISFRLPGGLSAANESTCQSLLTALMLYFAQLHSEYPENIEVMEA